MISFILNLLLLFINAYFAYTNKSLISAFVVGLLFSNCLWILNDGI